MLHSQFHKKETIVVTVTVTFYHQLSVVVFVKVLKYLCCCWSIIKSFCLPAIIATATIKASGVPVDVEVLLKIHSQRVMMYLSIH